MPPVTRRAWKAFQRSRGLSTCSSKSVQGENDLQLCLTNYFKGATGDFSAEHGLSPPNSEDELEMENAARRGRGKTAVDVSSSDEEVEVPTTWKGKGKVKKGKRKRKLGDMSTDSFFSGSSPQFQQYFRVLDSVETHLSCKNSSSMSGSVSSPSKTAHPPFDAYAEFKAALAKLCALNLDINVRLKVADALKDPSERAIWFTCKTDTDRLAFVRHRGFLPPSIDAHGIRFTLSARILFVFMSPSRHLSVSLAFN